MKARIQLCKSDKTDSTFFSSDGKIYNILSPIRNVQKGTNCEMLIVAKTDNYTPGDYYLICEPNKNFVVEKLARITQIDAYGVREMFIGQAGTVVPLDCVEQIIASTYSDKFKGLPRPHGVFLDKYTKNYNKGQKIVYIDVETYANDPHKKVRVLRNGSIVIKPWDDNLIDHSGSMKSSINPDLLKTNSYRFLPSNDDEPDFDEMFRNIMKEIDANEKESSKAKNVSKVIQDDRSILNDLEKIQRDRINESVESNFDETLQKLMDEFDPDENDYLQRELEAKRAESERLSRENEIKAWASLLDGLYPERQKVYDNTIKILDIEINEDAIHITMEVPDDMAEDILEAIEVIQWLDELDY